MDQNIPKEELDKKGTTKDINGYYEENIVDVSPSALVSLTAAISIFQREGISRIFVPSYLPVRWNSKRIMYERKIKHYQDSGESKEQLNVRDLNYLQEQLLIQQNITDKFIRNYRRIAYHIDGFEITAFPLDVDSSMHLETVSTLSAYNPNHLLAHISSCVIENIKKSKTTII